MGATLITFERASRGTECRRTAAALENFRREINENLAELERVVGQIALALVFLAAAGVLTRSFVMLVRTPLGYEPEGLIEVSMRRAGAPRFAVVLFGAFALLAVALATVGLFAVVSYAVARRTREIGVRVALGAGPGVVGRLILGNGLRLVMVGCGLGLLGVYAATRMLTAFCYDVSPPDTTLLVGAVLLLIAIALVASVVPMRRALRIDPTKTLRAE